MHLLLIMSASLLSWSMCQTLQDFSGTFWVMSSESESVLSLESAEQEHESRKVYYKFPQSNLGGKQKYKIIHVYNILPTKKIIQPQDSNPNQGKTVAHQKHAFLSARASSLILSLERIFKYCGFSWITDLMSLSGNLLSGNQWSSSCGEATKSAEMHVSLFSRCAALYSYTPHRAEELELSKGEMVGVYGKFKEGWLRGLSLRTGKVGILPANYVTPVLR